MAEDRYPIVKTGSGAIAGERTEGVIRFRGIPYGGRVDRERRFRAAEPAPAWEGVLDCTRNGEICIQPGESIVDSKNFGFYFSGGHPERFGTNTERQGENCLHLNVVTPDADDRHRPVMVYIHGGGFATNSGTLGLGSGRLAKEQDIVVVSITHRLHFWGYLYLGDLDSSFKEDANAGQQDLVLALKWIRDNIAAFGGDPDNVTLFGESGGAGKINNLLHMPSAAGLFHKAILNSGSMPVGKTSVSEAAAVRDWYLGRLGISGSPAEIICALQSMPAAAMIRAALSSEDMFAETARGGKRGYSIMDFGPAADGAILPAASGDGYDPGEFYNDVPLIIGSSSEELAAFSAEDAMAVTEDNLREKLLETGPAYGLFTDEGNVDGLIAAFRKDAEGIPAYRLFMRILSQGSMLGGGAFIQAMRKAGSGGAPVYRYLNTAAVPHNYLEGAAFAWHTFDLPLQLRIVPYPELEKLSRDYARLFAQFMRTGDPSVTDGTDGQSVLWKPFTREERQTLVFHGKGPVLAGDPLCGGRIATDRLKKEKEEGHV